MTRICAHVPAAPHAPRAMGCEECLGCCDSSPGRHATKHFQTARHPVVQSFEPGESWGWCYVEAAMTGPFPPAR